MKFIRWRSCDTEIVCMTKPHSWPTTVYQMSQENSPPPPEFKLFIGKVPSETTQEELLALFENYGKTQSCKLLPSKKSISSYGYVIYNTKEEADNAIAALHGHELHGRNIRVVYADPSSHDKRRRDDDRFTNYGDPRDRRRIEEEYDYRRRPRSPRRERSPIIERIHPEILRIGEEIERIEDNFEFVKDDINARRNIRSNLEYVRKSITRLYSIREELEDFFARYDRR